MCVHMIVFLSEFGVLLTCNTELADSFQYSIETENIFWIFLIIFLLKLHFKLDFGT